MTFIDLFSGTGGFRRGMELAGHKCVGFCEIDRFAYMSYVSMHLITDEQRGRLSSLDFNARQKEIMKEEYRNGEWYANDISRLDARDIPRADCWCFGFPCQDISVAGKQAGFTGNRSSLFFRVMYLLQQIPEEDRPHTLLIENVKNLLSINGGWDFARVLSALDEGGYDAEWQVLNSKDFGVPQNRERIFIIGHSRNRRATEVFPIEGTDGAHHVDIMAHNKTFRRNLQTYSPEGITETLDAAQGGGRGHYVGIDVIADIREHEGHGRDSGNTVITGDGISSAVKAQWQRESQRVAIKAMGTLNPERHSQMDVMSPDGICQTLDTIAEKKKIAIPVLTPDRAEKRQNGRRFKEDGEPSFTLTSEDRHGVAVEVEKPKAYGVYVGVSKDFQRGLFDDVSRCLKTEKHDAGIAVEVKNATKQGYDVAQEGVDAIDLQFPESKLRRARVGHGYAHALDTSCKQGILVTMPNGANAWAVYYPKGDCYVTIRKLTPKECYRLQGWADEYFDRAAFVNSDSQLYRQAGNGVTVPVIEAIARRLCDDV